MKKNNSESSAISELLKKLHASYLGGKKTDKPRASKPQSEDDDSALMDQLKATLSKATEEQEKPKKKAKKAPVQPTEEIQDDVLAVEETPVTEEPPIPEEQPVIEETPIVEEAPAPKVKKPRAPRKKKEASIEAPVIEETVIEEPAIEEAAMEEPAIEEPTVEETVVEENITVEPVANEEIVEDVIEKIVEEPSVVAEEESTPPAPTETVARRADVAKPTPQKKQPIRISPRITKPVQKDTAFVIKPQPQTTIVITPPTQSHPTSAQKAPSDSIVIRPPTSRSQAPSESIVIRPRVTDYTPPRPKVAAQPVSPQTSITIEAMQKKEEKKEVKKVPEKKQVSLPPQRESEFLKKNTPEEPTRQVAPRPAPAPKATVKQPRKKTRRIRDTRITSLPEDAYYNEALEDAPESFYDPPAIEEIPMDEPEDVGAQTEKEKLTMFSRRRLHKQQMAEKQASATDQVRERNGLSETDTGMMFELGYENELGRLVGYDTMKKLRYEHLRKSSHSDHRHYRTAFGYRGEEYVDTNQNEQILAAYSKDKRSLIRRLLLTALITLLLLFADMAGMIGGSVAQIGADYPYLFSILSAVGLLLAAALSYRQLYAGMRSLMRFAPTPYSTLAVTVPLCVIFSLIRLIPGLDGLMPVGFAASFLLLLYTVCDTVRLCCELKAFRTVSVKTDKTVLELTTPRKKKLLHGDKIVMVINEDFGEDLFRVRTAEHTTGFFRRFNDMEYASRPVGILTCVSLFSLFFVGFFASVFTESVLYSLTVGMTLLLLSTPISASFAFFYPLFRANALLSRRNCALVGSEALDEYSEEQTVIFNDTDLCDAEKCTQISVREDDDFRRDIKLAEILFRKMGGTLGKLAPAAAKKSEEDPPVAFLRIADFGVEAVVDNTNYILLGNADFLRRSGIHVPRETSDMLLRRAPNVSIMYIAIDSVLKLSYEIQYSINPDFEDLIALLAGDGTEVAIHSYDPNLNDTFLQTSRNGYEDPIGVIRPGRFDADGVQEVVDTGAVALGDRCDVALPLHVAKCAHAARKNGMRLQLVTSLIGAGIAVLLTVFDRSLSPLAIAGYQLATVATTLLTTHLSLGKQDLEIK